VRRYPHAGAARWAWNWGLSVRRKAFQRRSETLGAAELHRLLNYLKRTPRYGWLYEVSKVRTAGGAARPRPRLPAVLAGQEGRPAGGVAQVEEAGSLPRPVPADRHHQGGARRGGVATARPTGKFAKWGGRVLSATCRREADRWYCSLTVEVTRPDPAPVVGPVVGVDRGIHTFAVCSDGTSIQNPKALRRNLRTLRRRSRAVSRKQKGSRNQAKATLALARCHRKVRNQRLDALHKATTMLAKAKSVIVVEDLHVAGLVRNRRLTRAISDQGWAAFHRQLAYKCDWYGSRLLLAPRFYPSSKRCSACGLVKGSLPLAVRTFICQGCGLSSTGIATRPGIWPSLPIVVHGSPGVPRRPR
jgi:putative transposase